MYTGDQILYTSGMKKLFLGAIAVLVLAVSTFLNAKTAQAVFQGQNGSILYTKITPYSGPYVSPSFDGNIYIADADGANERVFRTDGYATGYYATFSPLGGRIAWSSNDTDIYISDLNGENIRLIRSGEDVIRPQWHPSGLSLFYTNRLPNYSGINLISLNKATERTLLHTGYGDMSPDGNNYLHSSPYSPEYSLEYMDGVLSLSEPPAALKTFTTGQNNPYPRPVWSPDSTKFALRVQESGENIIKIYNFETKAVIDQFTYPGWDPLFQNITMLWSPDGNDLLISGNLSTSSPFAENYVPDYAILKYDLSTNEATRLPTSWSGSLLDWQSLHQGAIEPQIPPISVYRFYNPTTKHHFYTASDNEANYIKATMASTWSFEGASFGIRETSSCPADQSVYRFWSDTKQGHFYTIDTNERDYIIANYPQNVWRYEGTAYCAYKTSVTNTPLYRFWSDTQQSHFYTTSIGERDHIIATYPSNVWRYEGTAYWVAD